MNRTNKRNLTVIGKKTLRNPLINSNIITTPYERVLSILNNIKQFISNIIKDKSNLINDIDWCIKIITSHSLYSYELKDKDTINVLSKENNEFKELVDFVSEYNEKVIKMNRKYNYILSDKLLEKSSIKLNRKKIERKSTFAEDDSHLLKLMYPDMEDNDKKKNEYDDDGFIYSGRVIEAPGNFSMKNKKNHPIENSNLLPGENIKNKKHVKINKEKNLVFNTKEEIKSYNSKKNEDPQKVQHKSILKNKKKFFEKELNENSTDELSFKKNYYIKNKEDHNNNGHIKTSKSLFNKSIKGRRNSISIKQISKETIKKGQKDYSFTKIQNILLSQTYDLSKLITSKNFDIFKLESMIGYKNVLPMIGRTILENLGLLDEAILNQNKLDNFLVSVSDEYKVKTLYHNSMHGADVTQSSYLFFARSNAEKIAKTNVIDILSVIIAALGHDIGHPGLTNMFHMNDSTDIAITYNDISILENFHASLLFRTLRKSENNIFEKLSNIDYKIIRKRMISEILATDMANHGKVVSVIKSRIILNENNEYKLNLLSGNEQTKNEEQQYLLDFIIHLADLGHNTKLFEISLKWVSLLSEEFWRQGDLEKQKNLPVSFLCDRDKINIPQSQKGFISGFIIPTFESLVSVFPSLKFTIDNAKNNLKEWQKLLDEGRATGWTPKKNRQSLKEKNTTEIKERDYLGFSNNYTIQEFNDQEENKSEYNDNNNIKSSIDLQNKLELDNNKKIENNKKAKNRVLNNNKKIPKINNKQINKSFNNNSLKINKIIKEKIVKSSKEIKKTNKNKEKNNKHLKISILDDLSHSQNNAIDVYLNSFSNLNNNNRKKYK